MAHRTSLKIDKDTSNINVSFRRDKLVYTGRGDVPIGIIDWLDSSESDDFGIVPQEKPDKVLNLQNPNFHSHDLSIDDSNDNAVHIEQQLNDRFAGYQPISRKENCDRCKSFTVGQKSDVLCNKCYYETFGSGQPKL